MTEEKPDLTLALHHLAAVARRLIREYKAPSTRESRQKLVTKLRQGCRIELAVPIYGADLGIEMRLVGADGSHEVLAAELLPGSEGLTH